MAGIGKTHLAREIYQHPIVLQSFDLSVWVSVGPQQQLKNVWVDVLAQVERKPKNIYLKTSILKLIELLQHSLGGRRYLIVLDDIWSTEVCGSLIRFLRAQGNGRRVLLTTRLEQVAIDLGTSIHHVRFLNNDESWELLWKNVFAHKSSFPPQLDKAGKKIAEKCEGLPLLILTVADILSGVDKTEEYWNKVADAKTTTFPDAYDKIAKVLFLSFEYLPQYLKACFLYMGVFPQSCEIPLSKLINLLIVEDFMEPEPSQTGVRRTLEKAHVKPKQPSLDKVMRTSTKFDLSKLSSTCRVMKSFETLGLLEPGPSLTRIIRPFNEIDSLEPEPSLTRAVRPSTEIDLLELQRSRTRYRRPLKTCDFMENTENFAAECLEKLVSNSLIIVCKHSSKSRTKSCKLHSAYWHLCVKEARKNKFFHVLKKLSHGSKDYTENQRRLCVQNSILFGIKEVYNSMADEEFTRSLLCTGEDHEYPVPICFNLMFLKVLDALAIRFYDFPNEVLQLLQLRYLALTHNGKVPSSILKLHKLEFLIVRQHHNIKLLRDSCLPNPKEINPRSKNKLRSMQRARDSTWLPAQIWQMRQLRHLRVMGSSLPDPRDNLGLPNLLTLYINAHSCTEAVFSNIPFLKKLGIKIEFQPEGDETILCYFEHIRLLDELESLKCVVINPHLRSEVVAPPEHLTNLSRCLKKLSLNGIGYPWKYMNVIGSLPNLQVLKLRCSAFRGAVWETEGGEFQRLEYLLLEDSDIVHWTTYGVGWITDDDYCFPHLQHLIIRHCYKLKEIPLLIGANPTLKSMEVVDCSPSVVASALRIQKKISALQLVINSSWSL